MLRIPRGVPLVLRWDLDKTYLRTEFDNMRDLIRLARESAEEKKAVPGATTLLKGLVAESQCRLTFVSGSPTQMRKVLEEKLHLDGIDADRLILKPNLAFAMKGRFRAIRGQVAYKLPALLAQRTMVPRESPEICFGDDAEADAFIYRLYGDVVAGHIRDDRLTTILTASGAYPDQIEHTQQLAQSIRERAKGRDPVARVFIHLDRKSEPGRFTVYGPRVVAISNYGQAALILHVDGVLSLARFLDVVERLIDVHDVHPRRLANAFQALVRRGVLTPVRLGMVLTQWADRAPDTLPALRTLIARQAGAIVVEDAPHLEGEHPDYEALIAAGHLHRAAHDRTV